jgi:hypothetical protein
MPNLTRHHDFKAARNAENCSCEEKNIIFRRKEKVLPSISFSEHCSVKYNRDEIVSGLFHTVFCCFALETHVFPYETNLPRTFTCDLDRHLLKYKNNSIKSKLKIRETTKKARMKFIN